MERESFKDEETAQVLNENFVSIKVDREERPDIDRLYMKTCMLMTGSGGWPLTIIMTPKKQPFFAATYLPNRGRAGMKGLLELLRDIGELWKRDRRRLVSTAGKVTEHLADYVAARRRGEKLTDVIFDEAFIRLLDSFDNVHGGFGLSPKFPSPHNLLFLLRYWKRTGRRQALDMVEKTLQKMRLGGIFDQLGYGFHRYSIDPTWLVPHFEKMLYDQALMTIAYIEAYQATQKEAYRKIAEQVLEYVLRDMRGREGGFFSAEDADSEGQEGKFYLWTNAEIRQELGEEASLIARVFYILEEGNYVDLHKGQTGHNILHLRKPLPELSSELEIKYEKLAALVKKSKLKLLKIRDKRVHPLKDDKFLTDWNSLMIAALAKSAKALGSKQHLQAARKATDFLLRELQRPDGMLYHRLRDGEASVEGNLDDYAFFILALIELYEATFETEYLKEALKFQDYLIKHFWDHQNEGFFFTADYGEKLLVRYRDFRDGAIPSGNSVALLNLVRLARMTGNTQYEEKAAALAKAFSSHLEGEPSQNTMFMAALDFFTGPTSELVIVGDPNSEETKKMLYTLRSSFIPDKTILFKNPSDLNLESIAHFTKGMSTIDNKTTAYICRNFVCSRPLTDVDEIMRVLTHSEASETPTVNV